MTASAIPLSSNSAYMILLHHNHRLIGTDAMKDLGGGHYGMFAADGNGDGGIYG